MIEFLKLRASSMRIKGYQHPPNGARAAIAAQKTVQYSTVARQRTSVGFKLAVCGDSRAGGLVAPLSCTAYFGELAILFCCSLQQQG